MISFISAMQNLRQSKEDYKVYEQIADLRAEVAELKAEIENLKRRTIISQWEYQPFGLSTTYTMCIDEAIKQIVNHLGLKFHKTEKVDACLSLTAPPSLWTRILRAL